MFVMFFYDFFIVGGDGGPSYVIDSTFVRLPRSNTPILISKHPNEDNLLFFHPRTRSSTRHRIPGISGARLRASALEGWLLFTGGEEGHDFITMYNVNTEEYRELPREDIEDCGTGLFSVDFEKVLFVHVDEALVLHVKSYERGQVMWSNWMQEDTHSIASNISGFIYGDNYIYWLDMLGIHLFELKDEGGDEPYEVINHNIQAQHEIALGCLICEDEYTFDLLTLQQPLRLKQFNLNLDLMEHSEEEINSLGATCLYGIHRRARSRDKHSGYRLPAEAEWDTGKIFLYGPHSNTDRQHCTSLDMAGLADVIATCSFPICTCDFGWMRLDPR